MQILGFRFCHLFCRAALPSPITNPVPIPTNILETSRKVNTAIIVKITKASASANHSSIKRNA